MAIATSCASAAASTQRRPCLAGLTEDSVDRISGLLHSFSLDCSLAYSVADGMVGRPLQHIEIPP